MRKQAKLFDVAILGSGFAGSILARILASQGWSVVLVERGRHPRFALGESTTPLANLCLERLAQRYGLPDLHRMATYGRWQRHLPELRCGLKRGFSFYAHALGEPYRNGEGNEARLLVAASPEDELADTHWLRADVDAFLAGKAKAAGVTLLEETEIQAVERDSEEVWALHGNFRGEEGRALRARFLVDGTGGAGFLSRSLGLPERKPDLPPVGLVYAHVRGLVPFAETARAANARIGSAPYPDDLAAVHHLLPTGWIYALPFAPPQAEGGLDRETLVSVGAVLFREPGDRWRERSPRQHWCTAFEGYPTLRAQLAAAEPEGRFAAVEELGYRRCRAAGDGWALLPHSLAFFDPIFSTGIAWSLLGVERLAELFGVRGTTAKLPATEALEAYGDLLGREADQVERLVGAARAVLPGIASPGGFQRFVAVALAYFATVSFAELEQRLCPELGSWRRSGFLGTGDLEQEALFSELRSRVRRAEGGDPPGDDLGGWVRRKIAPRNLLGLGDPARRNLYPVDLELLRSRSELLGLSPSELEGRLPLLRSGRE